MEKLKYIVAILIFFPTLSNAADSLFVDSEDEVESVKQGSTLLGGLLGSDQLPLNKSGKWERFRPLEAYGQDSSVPQQDPNELYEQEKATQKYLQARDPFSNNERIENVREALSPSQQQ